MSEVSEYWKEQMKHLPTMEYYETLVWLIEGMKKDSVLELGTGWGISGSAFLDSGVKELVSVDCNLSTKYGEKARREMEWRKKDGQMLVFMDERMTTACDKLIAAGRTFDLVYIDGGHDYENVMRDLDFAAKLVSPTGAVVMDDYLHVKNVDPGARGDWYGIQRAVREFLLKSGYQARIVPTKVNGFLVIEMESKNRALFR